ncbi:MAG TPA: hypothetical protein ENH05_06865 [Rhizobiales bacterium]|nr:hypothetical protein [Hyphomicrobiales bacterium]
MSLVMNPDPRGLRHVWRLFFVRNRENPGGFGVYYAIIAGQLLVLAAAGLQTSVPLERLFRDTIAVAEEYPGCCHVYDGLISNLGILLWWAAASITGFAALTAAGLSCRRYEILALAMAAAFSAWLAMDDLFMLHESVLPLIGFTQPMTYALYGLIAAAYIALSWRVVLMASPLLLAMAIAMLGASVSVDILADHDLGAVSAWLGANPRIGILLDDGLKFLGIGFWFCLHMAAARAVITNAVRSRPQARPACPGPQGRGD